VFAALQAFEKRGCQTILSGNLLLPFKSDANLPKKGLVVKPFLVLNHRSLATAYKRVIFFRKTRRPLWQQLSLQAENCHGNRFSLAALPNLFYISVHETF